ncbi:MAG: papain fold toxin domain-containing protein, partial [Myxococcota bacterium]
FGPGAGYGTGARAVVAHVDDAAQLVATKGDEAAQGLQQLASRGGGSVGARNLGEAVASEMGENAGQFGKCVECASAAQQHLSDAGLSGTRVRIESKGPIGLEGPDGTWTRVENNGVHEYVESGGVVYDNFNPTGIPADQYNLATSGAHTVTATEF